MLPAAQKCQKPLFWSTRWFFSRVSPFSNSAFSPLVHVFAGKEQEGALPPHHEPANHQEGSDVRRPVRHLARRKGQQKYLVKNWCRRPLFFFILCIASCKGRVRGACFPSGGKPSSAPSSCFTLYNIRRTKTIDDPCFRMATVLLRSASVRTTKTGMG